MNITKNYGLIARLAEQRKPLSPQKVIKRVATIAFLSFLSIVFAAIFAWLIHNGNFVKDHTQLLASLCVFTGVSIFLFGMLAVFILLWESFVSAYIINLDLHNESIDRSVDYDLEHMTPDLRVAIMQIESELGAASRDRNKEACETVLNKVKEICQKYLLPKEPPAKDHV